MYIWVIKQFNQVIFSKNMLGTFECFVHLWKVTTYYSDLSTTVSHCGCIH